VFSRKTSTDRKVVGVWFCRRAFAGREILQKKFPGTDEWRSPGADGGQRAAAFAVYEHGTAAHSIHVLTLEHDTIGNLTAFVPPSGPQLFHASGLPFVLADTTRGEALSTPHKS
jgi:hypothetical protein